MTNKLNTEWIKPLPERVINKIAAGEVIERPAAVVKELVENSIDAGANKIDIIIEKSGTKLIKVVDNGRGINEAQVEIAFARHATSKIRSFDDLNMLVTYGFRGEALPSIASISRMRMVTQTHDADMGTEIIYEGGVLQSKQATATSPGTIIEVENIFYNTPARRKFLKTETTEARHISRTAMGMAIGRWDIGFSYSLNSRNILSLPSGLSLEERVSAVLGAGEKMVKVEGESGPVKITGYIGTPEMVQNNRYGQFIFINNRYIQSSILSHALRAGYGELIPQRSFPIGALLLQVDPHEVDVNVHPTKAEVRLSREREIHDAVYHLVKTSLQQDGIIPVFKGADFNKKNNVDYTRTDNFHQSENNQTYIPGIRSQEISDPKLLADLYHPPQEAFSALSAEPPLVNKKTGEIIFETKEKEPTIEENATVSADFRFIGCFADLYLLLQSGDDLYIIDQHTAHERVLFEETLLKIENKSMEGQNILFPVQLELNPEEWTVFEESLEMLNKSGFSVAPFGGRTINIEAMPEILSKKAPEKVFSKIIDDIASLKKSGYDLKKAMAQSIACRSAVMAGDRLSESEAQYLIQRLLRCENKYSCPHGRPTFIKINKLDLDKKFGRR